MVGSKIAAADNAEINIGGNLTTGTVVDYSYEYRKQTEKGVLKKKTTVDETQSIKNIGSEITTGGDMSMNVGGNATFAGTTVNVDDDADINVAGNTNIIAVMNSEYSKHTEKRSAWFGIIKENTINESDIIRNQIANITAEKCLDINVGGTLTSIAGNFNSGRNLNISANSINLLNAVDSDYSYYYHQKKIFDLIGIITETLTAAAGGFLVASPYGLLAGIGGAVDAATEPYKGNRQEEIDIDETVLKTTLKGKGIILSANNPIVIEETLENDYQLNKSEEFGRNLGESVLRGVGIGLALGGVIETNKDKYETTWDGVQGAAGNIWAVPNTAAGLVWGGAGMMFGADVKYNETTGTFEFTENPIGFGNSAMSLGNTVNYFHDYKPDMEHYSSYNNSFWILSRAHEYAHTQQSKYMGPLYLPIYFINGGPFVGHGNWMEKEADEYGATQENIWRLK
jgi:hypothetical protein